MFPIRDNNPTRGTAYVTIGLIILNCGILLLSRPDRHESSIAWKYGFVPAQLLSDKATFENALEENIRTPVTDRLGRPLANRFTRELLTQPDQAAIEAVRRIPAAFKLITSMFLHGGWMHLIGNMLFLWIFGNNIEDRLGPVVFIFFYLATGVLATLTHAYFDPGFVPLVGASGAISGVMGAYVVLYPRARILAVVPLGYYPMTVSLPAWIYMIFYIVIQNLYPATFSLGQGVAHWAHLGGVAAGVALIFVIPKRKPVGPLREIHGEDADLVI